MNQQMFDKIRSRSGFIAALDQSGGSTPTTLAQYGVEEDQYANDVEMYDLIHEMRTRILTSPNFDSDRVIGAILLEDTMDRQLEGRSSADYLWSVKQVVPFLTVDKGLADEADGVQLMKPIPGLDETLARARERDVFGTKMRSVVRLADPTGIAAIVDQQFEVGAQIFDSGLTPILEPDVDIHSPEKEQAEVLLRDRIMEHLGKLPGDQHVILKLTIPSVANFYRPLIEHPRVVRGVALSGGYPRAEANERLSCNEGMIASFSRAMVEGLSVQQSDAEFEATLDATIASIFDASVT